MGTSIILKLNQFVTNYSHFAKLYKLIINANSLHKIYSTPTCLLLKSWILI